MQARRISPVAFALACAITATVASPALGQAPLPLASAHLQGQFLLAGRVTTAKGVRGEHVGQSVRRTWAFTPRCPAGPCSTIGLVRARAAGSDRLLLTRRAPGYYVGKGSFFAPLRCGSRVYRKGSAVPFTITVRITGARLFGAEVVATRVSATYTNRSRRNLTPCIAVLGHDAATYHGHLIPPSGGAGT